MGGKPKRTNASCTAAGVPAPRGFSMWINTLVQWWQLLLFLKKFANKFFRLTNLRYADAYCRVNFNRIPTK